MPFTGSRRGHDGSLACGVDRRGAEVWVVAGWWTTGLDAAFLVAARYQLSVVYQAVMATAAGFAVHLLLPRR